jgi:colicin import membrane protein
MKSRARRIGLTSKALVYAIVVHVIVGVLLILNIDWPTHVVSSPPSKPAPVQANMIDEREIEKQMEAIKKKDEIEKQKQLEAQKKLDDLLKKKKEEEQRLAEIKKQQEQEKKKAEELARKKEQEQLELAKLRKKEEEEEQRKKAEAEAKAKAEAERKRKEEEERKRKAEEQRKKELAEERERERQLQERLESERRQRLVNDALAQYIPIIKQKVSRNWNRPTSLRNNIEAHVNVRLSQAGEVISARIVKSSGDAVFDRSVENAVLKASPLPIPQARGVNEEFRNLKLIFRPEELIS